jgi:hypothetical protein
MQIICTKNDIRFVSMFLTFRQLKKIGMRGNNVLPMIDRDEENAKMSK